MPASIQSVLSLTHFFRSAGIDNFIYGGWALDLHLQRQSRLHDDIDNFIPHTEHEKFISILESNSSDATILHDAPYKTTWISPTIVPDSYIETHYYRIIDNSIVSLGYPKDWIKAPIDVFTSVPYFPHKKEDGHSDFIPVVSKELVVAMCERWGFHRSDITNCKELKSACDPEILSKIILKEFY